MKNTPMRSVLLAASRWCRQKLDLLDGRLQGGEAKASGAQMSCHHAIEVHNPIGAYQVASSYQRYMDYPIGGNAQHGRVLEEYERRRCASDRGNLTLESRDDLGLRSQTGLGLVGHDYSPQNCQAGLAVPAGTQFCMVSKPYGDGITYRSDDGGMTWTAQPERAA